MSPAPAEPRRLPQWPICLPSNARPGLLLRVFRMGKRNAHLFEYSAPLWPCRWCRPGSANRTTMVSVCWTSDNLTGLFKILTFLELAAANMLAITNLAICVNLALIVISYRTVPFERRRPSSPLLVSVSFVISVAAAAASAPFWDTAVITGTTFWPTNYTKRGRDWISVSNFFIEFIVGGCMFIIVTWLLLFWMGEIKECWKNHVRVRYYFGLTLIGTLVNLALGVCGTAFVVRDSEEELLIVLTLTFRYIHVALDTIILHGVLSFQRPGE
ncbi:unnamed protein product [Pylaiella littoralis]